LSLSQIIKHAETLPSGTIPPQLAVYPVPGFYSVLECKTNEYIPVNILILILLKFNAHTVNIFVTYVGYLQTSCLLE
jgi:hypothetical protein